MIRITLQYVWSLSESIETLGRLDATVEHNKMDLALDLYDAKGAIELLLQSSVFSGTLRSSTQLAQDLLRQINSYVDADSWEGAVAPWEIAALKRSYEAFKIAFLAELGTLPAYFVSQKGGYDTLSLLDAPARMFPDDLSSKVPEAMFDVQQAGKCLCYETATACGFHLFRATEAVLRRYYTHVTGGAPHPKVRNIAVYIEAMRRQGVGDEVILSVVAQLSKLHRNPLIHPEVALTIDEAISILGIARSAVTAMLSQLPVVPQTTGSAPTEAGLIAEKPKAKVSKKKSGA
ncbi:hypothetical protein [Hyphomicrobium sp. LHD-15]|uniref:hypothetical protein n=1 Tax=Hyphomicrobium sp. LHD-15 TaxID=3072142 RepID=UPI00280F928F|nr:hypothetical protein [Hyphomicrobium sp. LHD-15]MDQ8699383.1 hypothetical protein [Hyphomicrobium sp. LHD-15]